MKSQKPNDLKQHNVRAIRELLSNQTNGLTKSDIANAISLSVVTTNKLISEMLKTGEVITLQNPVATGGRKAFVYKLNPSYRHLLAIQFVEQAKQPVAFFTVSTLEQEAIFQQIIPMNQEDGQEIIAAVAAILQRYPKTGVISIGIPGVEIDGSFQIMDFSSIKNTDLRNALREMTDLPILIENDINAATFGFSKLIGTHDIVAGIYFLENYAPGSGLVIKDAIFRGANGLSGELKHLSYFEGLTFPITEDAQIMQMAEQSMRTIISMYDPQELVIFDTEKMLSAARLDQLLHRLKDIFPYGYLPEVTLQHDLSTYYLKGLNELALQFLQELPI